MSSKPDFKDQYAELLKDMFGYTPILYTRKLNPIVQITYTPLARKDTSYWRKRTIKERLFSLPWKPWKELTLVPQYKPLIYKTPYGIIAHPDFKEEIEKHVQELNQKTNLNLDRLILHGYGVFNTHNDTT